MKNVITLLTMLLLIISCNTNNIDDTSKRNEHWVWWIDINTNKGKWRPIEDGPLNVKGDGYYTLFYFNGNIYQKGKIINNHRVDTTLFFNMEGNPQAYDIPLDSSKFYFFKDGKTKLYYANGKLLAQGFVKNHVASDEWIDYYKDETVKEKFIGKGRTGWKVRFYESGEMKDCTYVVDKNEYLTKAWNENGQLMESYGYSNGGWNGIAKTFYANGHIKDSGFLINDKLNGVSIKWYENGKVRSITGYKIGTASDSQKLYYENGNIKAIVYLKDTVKISRQVFDSTGTLISNDKY